MKEKTANTIAHTLAGLVALLTLSTVVLTLAAFAEWKVFTQDGMQLLRTTPFLFAFISLLFVALLGSAIAYGLWQRKNWGRILAIFFSIIVIIDVTAYLFHHPLNISLLLTLTAAAGTIWLLTAQRDVVQLFRK
jgi:hypothetical protein